MNTSIDVFSEENMEKYGKNVTEIFEIEGLKYPGIVLAFLPKISVLSEHTTQEEANIFCRRSLKFFIEQICSQDLSEIEGFDLESWDPSSNVPDSLIWNNRTSAKLVLRDLTNEDYEYETTNICSSDFDGENLFVYCLSSD